jgi:thiamine biosynthesis lipoprotein
MLERINNIMSTYRDYSTISIFNKYKNNNMFFVDSEMSYIVRNALRIKRLFNGLFDITLAPLIDLWGFDKINVFDIPKNNIIKLYQNIIGLNKVIVVDKYLQKTHSEIKINLSGIAKGYGVDVIYQFIQNLGFKNFMIEIGGEIRVSNNRFKEWKIGILNPCIDNDKEKIVSIVKLKSGSLATSGTYLNYFTNNFKKYSHILNPNTGYPVDNNVLSVSIIAPSCMVADALCTVALILEENSFYNNIKYWKYVGAIFIYGNDKFSIGISKS